MTLPEFLMERLAEDEAVARGAWPARWEQEGQRNAVQTAETDLRGGYEGLHMGVANLAMTVGNYQAEARNAAHIARHDPARVLLDVASKRWIVASLIADDEREPAAQWMLREVCKALASVYADHPDYREEWRS